LIRKDSLLWTFKNLQRNYKPKPCEAGSVEEDKEGGSEVEIVAGCEIVHWWTPLIAVNAHFPHQILSLSWQL
jgi:hypothetical protein